MSRYRVVVTDSVFPSLDPAIDVLRQVGAEVTLAPAPTPEGILSVARQADGLLVTYARVTGDIIRQLEKCRIIARFGIGVDNVDVAAATERGIVVTNVPDYCVDEVSDHALALMLALVRKVCRANALVQSGTWDLQPLTPIPRLRGKTLGLIGFGKIPRALAPKAQALGLHVLAFDPYVPAEAMAEHGVEKVDLEALLRRSDIISVHAPLTPQTHHMLDRDMLQLVKPGVVIVNTARGPLIDEAAMVEALDEGRVAAAALDVLESEPPPKGHPLLGRENVIITPHMAFYSEESLVELQTKAAQEVARVLSGERPRYPVNPEVLSTTP